MSCLCRSASCSYRRRRTKGVLSSKRNFTLGLVQSVLVACSDSVSADGPAEAIGRERVVSLVELLVNPQAFEGSRINVQGFFDRKGELFITRDHAEMFDFSSAIMVEDQAPDGYVTYHCADSYARLEGTFRRKEGPSGQGTDSNSFVIAELTRVLTLRDGVLEVCWPSREAR